MHTEQWHDETIPLGDFVLDSGTTLRNAHLAYSVSGTLNSAGNNLVVLPTHYGGAMKANRAWAEGKRSPLSSGDYCLLIPALFGNGESSSPSNACAEQAGTAFPRTTLADNVRAQRQLIAARFNDAGPRLVAGWSMGGMQALQWGALYPERVRSLLAVCATARCYPHNALFLDGVKAALQADPALASGGFPQHGLRAFARVYAGWAYSQRFFRDGGYRALGFESMEALVAHWETDHLRANPHNLLAMLDTWQQGDIAAMPGFGEDTGAALANISAPTIAMPCRSDLYFTAEDAARDIAQIAQGECRIIESDFGHCAGGPGYEPASTRLVLQAMRDLLGGAA